MNIVKALWRGFVLLWTILCGIFLYGVIRTYLSNSMGFPFLGTAIALGMWAGGICAVWGLALLVRRCMNKPSAKGGSAG